MLSNRESSEVMRGERLRSGECRLNSDSKRRGSRLAGLSRCSLAVALLLVSGYLSLMPGAAGQLEAVGAFLSVVPVGPILTTAGVMGVKLAALSRLLQALGYDQAYLANGGAGTAAEPIGLQTKYAYMFPYVPGLNISVKGEHGTEFHNDAAKQREAAEKGGERKTFPAMGLPGDYEHQPRPFRGSDTLRDIFRTAGVNILVPSPQQQQQHAKAIFFEIPAARSVRSSKTASTTITPEFADTNKPVSLGAKIRSAASANGRQQEELTQSGNSGLSGQFGMPAVNIHPLRRRKRRAMD